MVSMQLMFLLDKYAGEMPSPYWITSKDCDADTYCHKCALAKIETIEGEAFLEGGYSYETDSTPFCETCGCQLSYSLTDWGCEVEYENWKRTRFRKPLNRHDAYAIARIVGSSDQPKYIKLARRAVKAITLTPSPTGAEAHDQNPR